MNGRVYDPAIGRFLSADPNIPHPYNSQSYNRYSYVLNNPLSLVDPSGFVDDDPSPQIMCDRDCQAELPEETQQEIRECQAANGGWGCALVDGAVTPISEVQDVVFQQYMDRAMAQINTVMNNLDREFTFDGGNDQFVEETFDAGDGWLDPAQTTLGGMGLFASLGEFTAGRTTLGSNFRLYASGWNGNQYVRTIGLMRTSRAFGHAVFGLGTAIDIYGAANWIFYGPSHPNAIHPAKASLNMSVAAWGMAGGPFTAIPAAGYFLIDATYPGGVSGALDDTARLQKRNREIMNDPSWSINGRGMGL